MKLAPELKTESPQEWIDVVLADFDNFLQDHADNERKASGMVMSFVAKYPDKTDLIQDWIDTGIEELEHFKEVYELMAERNIPLRHKIPEDVYVKQLMGLRHSGRKERFIDSLIVASLIESRGAERFKKVADNLEDAEMAKFYKNFWTSEAKHGHLFVKQALRYAEEQYVYKRYDIFLDYEAEIFKNLDIRPALH